MRCRVCGREGFDICPECQFREQNLQCWRCRIYIPRAEMQQWRGQWICPNCRMDLEQEEATAVPKEGRKGPEEEVVSGESYEKKGRCDRCGRETLILYRFNNRNLCWYCLEKEEDYTGAGPAGGAIPIQVIREKKSRKGWFRRIKEFFLGKEGREAEKEVSAAKIVPVKRGGREGEAAPAKKEERVEKAGERPEKRDSGPVIRKEKGEPSEEGKKAGKEEKKKPGWEQWKKD